MLKQMRYQLIISYGAREYSEGNIWVVGRIDCGKVTFVQCLALNNLFGKQKNK